MSPVLYLHVGHPKTATTHLQNRIFPLFSHMHVRVKPVCPYVFRNTRTIGGFDSDVIDLAFRRSPEVWDELGDQILDTAIGKVESEGQNVLLSSEGVSSCNTAAMAIAHYKYFFKAAKRAGFKDIKIIYGIRRQDDAFGSGYAQRSDFIARASQADFEKAVLELIDPASNFYLHNHGNYRSFPAGARYDYYGQYNALESVFGSVLTLPVEWLSDDPKGYYNALLSFVEAPDSIKDSLHTTLEQSSGIANSEESNKRSAGDAIWSLRPRNPWFTFRVRRSFLSRIRFLPKRVSVRPLEMGRGHFITMTPSLRKAILDRYRDSNRELAKVTGLDLKRYGYI